MSRYKSQWQIIKESEGNIEYYVGNGKWNEDKYLGLTYSKTAAQKARNLLATTFMGQMVYIQEIE